MSRHHSHWGETPLSSMCMFADFLPTATDPRYSGRYQTDLRRVTVVALTGTSKTHAPKKITFQNIRLLYINKVANLVNVKIIDTSMLDNRHSRHLGFYDELF